MMAAPCQTLPVVRVGEIPSEDHAQRWLVEQLWGASSVGLIGGAPKCSKTWLGLDLALSVATGTPCLGAYAVPEAGPVLLHPVPPEGTRYLLERGGLTLVHPGLKVTARPFDWRMAEELYGYRVAALVPDGAGGTQWTHAGYQVVVEVEPGQDAVELSWDPVPGATEYQLFRTEAGQDANGQTYPNGR